MQLRATIFELGEGQGPPGYRRIRNKILNTFLIGNFIISLLDPAKYLFNRYLAAISRLVPQRLCVNVAIYTHVLEVLSRAMQR